MRRYAGLSGVRPRRCRVAANGDRRAFAYRYEYADADGCAVPHEYADGYAFADCHEYVDANPNRDAFADCDEYVDANGYAFADCHEYADANGYANPNPNGYAFADSHEYADANEHTHSSAAHRHAHPNCDSPSPKAGRNRLEVSDGRLDRRRAAGGGRNGLHRLSG